MPLIVASLRDTHSHMTLTLYAASLIEQLAALRSGRTNIALIHTNPDLPLAVGDLRSITIATGPRMIVMRPDNPLASNTEIVLSDAADHPSSSRLATSTPATVRERKAPAAATDSSRARQLERTTRASCSRWSPRA
jgi:hypothetical protein